MFKSLTKDYIYFFLDGGFLFNLWKILMHLSGILTKKNTYMIKDSYRMFTEQGQTAHKTRGIIKREGMRKTKFLKTKSSIKNNASKRCDI